MAKINVGDSLCEVSFSQFDIDDYQLFLQCKRLPESQVSYDWQTDTYRVTTPARFATFLTIEQQMERQPKWWKERQEIHIYIYALIDPLTNQVRYIGKSVDPVTRFQAHCNDSVETWRTNWIHSLAKRGARPILLLLDRLADSDDWQSAERAWIAFGRERGWPLTNCTDGGDGVVNLPPEIRQRMSQLWLGRKHKPESIVKIGAASKGRTHSEEHKRRMSEIMSQRVFTEQHRRRLSLGTRKLSDEQVREIRRRLNAGERQYAIARDYGVDKGTISNIKQGRFYADVK